MKIHYDINIMVNIEGEIDTDRFTERFMEEFDELMPYQCPRCRGTNTEDQGLGYWKCYDCLEEYRE